MAGDKKTVLLIGSTGGLGTLIAKELLKRKASVNIRLLVRSGSKSKLASDVAANSEVVESEDGAFKDVDTVISSVQGTSEVIVDAQRKWLRAARDAGVSRFIPSSFSFNFFGLDEGENINSDWRRQFAKQADSERGKVEVIHVMNGCFLDKDVLFGFLGVFDLDKGEAYQWGDGKQEVELTTYADTAAYTAELAGDQATDLPSRFAVAGDVVTFPQLVEKVSAGLSRPITIKRLGSIDDLSAEITRRREAEPNNVLAWLPLMYVRGMFSGKGQLGPLANNRYPHIKPTDVIQYVKQMNKGNA